MGQPRLTGKWEVIYDSDDAAVSLPAKSVSTGTLPSGYRQHMIVVLVRSTLATDLVNLYQTINNDIAGQFVVAKASGECENAAVFHHAQSTCLDPENTTRYKIFNITYKGSTLGEQVNWESAEKITEYTWSLGDGNPGAIAADSKFVVLGLE